MISQSVLHSYLANVPHEYKNNQEFISRLTEFLKQNPNCTPASSNEDGIIGLISQGFGNTSRAINWKQIYNASISPAPNPHTSPGIQSACSTPFSSAAVIQKPQVVQANPDESPEELFVRNVFNEHPELITRGISLGNLHQRSDGSIILSFFMRYELIDMHKFDKHRFLRDLGLDPTTIILPNAHVKKLEDILEQFQAAIKTIHHVDQVGKVLVPIIKLYFETRFKNISDYSNNLNNYPQNTKNAYFELEKLVKNFPNQPEEIQERGWGITEYSHHISNQIAKWESACAHLNPDSRMVIEVARKHFPIYMDGWKKA